MRPLSLFPLGRANPLSMDDEAIRDIVRMVLIIGGMGVLAYLAYQFLSY
jgi:hypothetical protein